MCVCVYVLQTKAKQIAVNFHQFIRRSATCSKRNAEVRIDVRAKQWLRCSTTRVERVSKISPNGARSHSLLLASIFLACSTMFRDGDNLCHWKRVAESVEIQQSRRSEANEINP